MTVWNEDARRAPSPDQLAAYADGELDRPEMAPLKRQVEDWLATHPEAAAEVEAQRRLAQLWQATAPPEPAESAWAAVLARLQQPPQPVKALRWRPAAWVAGILAACAAAVLLALVLLRTRDHADVAHHPVPAPGVKNVPAPKEQVPPVEPFAVATADEVEILSVGGADTGTLVVGEVPVRGELVLPLPGEVEIKERADAEVRVGGSPMIWSPLANERDEE